MDSFLSEKLEPLHQSINGQGLRAKEKISKGETLIIFRGKKIPVEEANALYNQGHDYMLQVNHKVFLLLEGDEKYVNHSCEANSAFLYRSGDLVAIKEIKAGEEITFDYSLNENTPFKINCQCGSASCRKVIGPYSELSPSHKQSLDRYLTPYLRTEPD